jgi:excisionase family DNA binding protein
VAYECHHVPAAAFEDAVRQVPARRWLGLTATPYRRDKLDDLIGMQVGPVRHTVTTPRQADSMHMLPGSAPGGRPTPVLHLHPTAYRYGGAASPSTPGGMAIIYKDLISSDERTCQVIADVAPALGQGRNCLVLTNWTGHLETIAGALRDLGHDPVTLKGGMGAKDRAAALARLTPQPGGPPLLAVATGPYAGEGFDCPPLDTGVPRRARRQQGTPPAIRRADPAPLRRQGHRRGPRLPRRAHRSPRLIPRQTRTRLHQPRLPRPPQAPLHPQRQTGEHLLNSLSTGSLADARRLLASKRPQPAPADAPWWHWSRPLVTLIPVKEPGGIMPRTGVLGTATRIDPEPADHEALDGLRARGDLGDGELILRTADGTEITLPSSLLRLVISAASNLAAGHAVMTIAAEVTLTPAEAAELLGLSRPFVARLIERGDIPSELLPDSTHRRIRLEDVLAFQALRECRAEGRRMIADIAATAALPYLCLQIVARVFVDTNVLFPFSVMDLMLALTENGIHDVMWTDALLDEWERVIVQGQRRSPDAAAAITATVRQFFADTCIPVDSYRDLVSEVDGPDPDDNVHMAAAVAGRVEAIVTWNEKDFICDFIKNHAVAVVNPDIYLCSLYEQFPQEVLPTITRIAAGKRRPPMTPSAIVEALDRAGVREFASRVRPHLT